MLKNETDPKTEIRKGWRLLCGRQDLPMDGKGAKLSGFSAAGWVIQGWVFFRYWSPEGGESKKWGGHSYKRYVRNFELGNWSLKSYRQEPIVASSIL